MFLEKLKNFSHNIALSLVFKLLLILGAFGVNYRKWIGNSTTRCPKVEEIEERKKLKNHRKVKSQKRIRSRELSYLSSWS